MGWLAFANDLQWGGGMEAVLAAMQPSALPVLDVRAHALTGRALRAVGKAILLESYYKELSLLERLIYRSSNQHRSAGYMRQLRQVFSIGRELKSCGLELLVTEANLLLSDSRWDWRLQTAPVT